MHWQLGEQEMARRAGVVPFSLSSGSSIEPPPKVRRHTAVMPRLRRQSLSVASASQRPVAPPPPLGLPQGLPPTHHVPPPPPPPAVYPAVHPTPLPQPLPQSLPQSLPQTLPQPLSQGQPQGQPQLPSVEELTAGVPAYSSPVTQPIVDPYNRGSRPPPPMTLPHPHPSDVPGASPTMIPRTRI